MADIDHRRGFGGSGDGKQYDDQDRYQLITDRQFGWLTTRGGWELSRKDQENYTVMRRVSWRNYTNVRFQYTIRYPCDLLIPQGESASGDGERFLGRDGATLVVWGGYNTLGQTLSQFETDTVSRLAGNSGTATRRKRHPTWFVVSGVTDDQIFHAKTILAGDIKRSFEFTYPRENADVYRAVTARIVTTFRSLGQTHDLLLPRR